MKRKTSPTTQTATKQRKSREAIHRAVWTISAILVLLAFCGQAQALRRDERAIPQTGTEVFWPSSGIGHLFFTCGPAAISGLIVPIVVDALQRHAFRWSHISQEISGISPAFADIDPAAAIVFVVSAVRIQATLQHILPSSVFSRHTFSHGGPVFEMPSSSCLRIETAAAFSIARAQIRTSDNSFVSFHATTEPSDVSLRASLCSLEQFDDREASKCLA